MSFVTKDIIALKNEVGTNTLSNLRETLATLSADREVIVLGDFNLYHPLWSTTHRQANQGRAASQPLLTIIKDYQLQLLTVPGTTTHRWKDGESTINLTFAIEGVASRTIYCRIDTNRDYNSNYLPIATAVAWD